MPELSFDERVELLAREALGRWGLSGASLRLMNRTENSTYLVTPAAGATPVVLRVHREGYHSRYGILTELDWMRALQADSGVKTPQSIAGADGEHVQLVSHEALPNPRHCVLFEFIEGEELAEDQDLEGPFRQLGEVTARTHLHSERWVRPPYFERLTWDFEHMLGSEPNWGRWEDGPEVTPDRLPLLRRFVSVVERRLQRFGRDPRRYGLAHSDLRLANLLVHEGDVRVIDFDDSGVGWFLYDLGSALTLLEDSPELDALIASWLEGYLPIRTLTPDEIAEIPTFMMLRRMMVLAWMGSHSDTELAHEQRGGYVSNTLALADRYLSKFDQVPT